MKLYTHLLFDLDRTLWDLEVNAKTTLLDLYDKYSLSNYFETANEFIEKYTQINNNLWAEYTRGNINKTKLRTTRFHLTLKQKKCNNINLAQQLDNYYVNNCPQQTALLPNCIEVLQYLKNKNYKMSIVTNGFADTQIRKLQNSKIDQYFKNIYDSETVGCAKPSKSFFKYVLKNENIEASNAIIIGDDWKADINGAAMIGIDQIYLNSVGEYDGPASYKIKNLNEITNIL